MKNKIVFKYTSRSRPDNFFRGLDSIVNNLHDTENYYIQCTFDTDDLSMNNKEVIDRLHTYKNLTYYFGESKNKIDAINKNLEKLTDDWSILVNMSDDQIFITQYFDKIIRDQMDYACDDTDMFLHFPDEHTGKVIPTMSIIGKKYFDRTGKIYHPDFKSVYSDNFEMDLAKYLGKYKFINILLYQHLHPCFGLAPMDEQYIKTENPIGYEEDRKTYIRLKAEFGY